MFSCFSLYLTVKLHQSIFHYPTSTTSQKLFYGTVTICISLSLRRTSAPIHLISVLGVLGTQETSCILIPGLLERDTFDHFLPKFDKPWVIHLRETRFYSTNLYTWRPNNYLQEYKCVDITS